MEQGIIIYVSTVIVAFIVLVQMFAVFTSTHWTEHKGYEYAMLFLISCIPVFNVVFTISALIPPYTIKEECK